MNIVIGFADKYWTLWEVSDPYENFINATDYVIRIDHNYVQNLSYYLKEAEEKVRAKYPGRAYTVDSELRGIKSWTEQKPKQFSTLPKDVFPYGRLKGQPMMESDDVWQLFRVYRDENTEPRRRIYARKRLIELKELIKKDHSYLTKEELIKRNHFYNDGEKVTLTLTLKDRFWFSTAYGKSCVQTFVDQDNQEFKYVGSSPVNMPIGDTARIKCEIEHVIYKDKPETNIKRPKLCQS